MKLVQVAEQNEKYFTEEFILGFNTGAKNQYEADSKERLGWWVPVTERLPEEKGEYMVTVEYYGWHGEKGRMLTSTRYTKTKGWHFNNGKVTAWMPLPAPYKGGKE